MEQKQIRERDSRGRIVRAAGGRRLGSKNSVKTVLGRALERMAVTSNGDASEIERDLAAAWTVIRHEIAAGNAQVAAWLIDRTVPKPAADIRLATAVPSANFGSIPQIIKTSERVLELVAAGQLSLDQAGAVLGLFRQLVEIRSAEEIAELRRQLDDVERAGSSSTRSQLLPAEMRPRWARLQEG